MSDFPTGDGIERGRLKRAAPIAGLAAKTVGEAAVAAVRQKATGRGTAEFHARTAERYAEVLGGSKGVLMKVGQLLSFVSLLPAVPAEFTPLYQSALARLRTDAPPMAPELARAVLEQDLCRATEDAFAELDWDPLAAASIGQVHRARLHDGRKVAVKIQYPGVAEAIRADLENAELLATFLRLLFRLVPGGMGLRVDGMGDEIKARITEELDYRLEAANQAEFAAIYRGHPFIRVPDVVPELCTGRVLTQEFVAGLSWEEALGADQPLKDQWGEAITRFFFGPLHRNLLVNVDPHPGNYLFHDDGTVTFLDYGCVKRLPANQIAMLDTVTRAQFGNDPSATWRAAVEAGYLRASDPVSPEEIHEFQRRRTEPYFERQPVTITPDYVAANIRRCYARAGETANAARHITVPPELTLLGRVDLGLLAVIAELRTTIDWRAVLDELFAGAQPKTAMGVRERDFFGSQSTVDRSSHSTGC